MHNSYTSEDYDYPSHPIQKIWCREVLSEIRFEVKTSVCVGKVVSKTRFRVKTSVRWGKLNLKLRWKSCSVKGLLYTDNFPTPQFPLPAGKESGRDEQDVWSAKKGRKEDIIQGVKKRQMGCKPSILGVLQMWAIYISRCNKLELTQHITDLTLLKSRRGRPHW